MAKSVVEAGRHYSEVAETANGTLGSLTKRPPLPVLREPPIASTGSLCLWPKNRSRRMQQFAVSVRIVTDVTKQRDRIEFPPSDWQFDL